ncbi:MAG: hypothetical protein HQL57_11190, partial [Magnetococcales bacterium]|nr:hypothetical protein [Magnetococcales bacterium]
ITAALADREALCAMGEGARRHVLDHHTWEIIGERYVELLRDRLVAPSSGGSTTATTAP